MARQQDFGGRTPEELDIPLDPIQGRYLIQQAVVPWNLVIQSCQEPEDPQSKTERHNDHLATEKACMRTRFYLIAVYGFCPLFPHLFIRYILFVV